MHNQWLTDLFVGDQIVEKIARLRHRWQYSAVRAEGDGQSGRPL